MAQTKAAKYKTQIVKLPSGPLTIVSRGKATRDADGKDHLPVVYLHGAGGLVKSRVHEMLSPIVDLETAAWLAEATRPLGS